MGDLSTLTETISTTMGNDWDAYLNNLQPTVDLSRLRQTLAEKYRAYPGVVNPPPADIFRAFKETPLKQLKVVMIGQDPYPGHGVADGLAFSARLQKNPPASLINLNKEWNEEFKKHLPIRNDLTYLAEQGVFLYNTCLISRDGQPLFFSEERIFDEFSRGVINLISQSKKQVIFVLLGSRARQYEEEIDTDKHVVLKTSHPSPLSAYRGFFGSGVFRECNKYLSGFGLLPIDWLGLSYY